MKRDLFPSPVILAMQIATCPLISHVQTSNAEKVQYLALIRNGPSEEWRARLDSNQ